MADRCDGCVTSNSAMEGAGHLGRGATNAARRGAFNLFGHTFELRVWTPEDWQRERARPSEEDTIHLANGDGYAEIVLRETPSNVCEGHEDHSS